MARVAACSLLVLGALALVSCGDDEAVHGDEFDVGEAPRSVCYALAKRKRLADHPPKLTQLGLQLRHEDLDVLRDKRQAACNRRALVYWGPPPALSGSSRPAVQVTLQFWASPEDAQQADRSIRGGRRARLDDGTAVRLFREARELDFEVGAVFVSGQSLVSVRVGCVAELELLEVNDCERRSEELDVDPLRLLNELREQLDGKT
jgi:hypothetical protein